MANDFQTWLKAQGYVREHETYGVWSKDKILVSGKELQNKLDEWNMFCNFQNMEITKEMIEEILGYEINNFKLKPL